jgi:hypothetical protein
MIFDCYEYFKNYPDRIGGYNDHLFPRSAEFQIPLNGGITIQ